MTHRSRRPSDRARGRNGWSAGGAVLYSTCTGVYCTVFINSLRDEQGKKRCVSYHVVGAEQAQVLEPLDQGGAGVAPRGGAHQQGHAGGLQGRLK